MTTDFSDYQQAFAAAGLSTSLRRRYANLAVGWTQPVQCAAPSGQNNIAVILEASVPLSATKAESVTANTDVIDEWLSGYEVAQASGADPRLKAQNRTEAEIIEMIAFDTGDQGTQGVNLGSYPRTAAAAFTASGTRTDTSSLCIPTGGPAVWVKFQIPAITGVFAANVSVSSYTVAWTEVYSTWAGIWAGKGVTTATLGTGLQDITDYYPAGIAADVVVIYGRTPGTDFDQFFLTNQAGAQTVAMDNTQAFNSVFTVYPKFAIPPSTQTTVALGKSRATQMKIDVLKAETFSFVFLQCTPAPAVSNQPAQTAVTPDVSKVGTPTPGTGPTAVGGQTSSGPRAGGAARGRMVPYG